MTQMLSAVSLVMPKPCVHPLGLNLVHSGAQSGWTSFAAPERSLHWASAVTVAGAKSPVTPAIRPGFIVQVSETLRCGSLLIMSPTTFYVPFSLERDSSTDQTTTIQLYGESGNNPRTGRVEVLYDGKYGTVCYDGWDYQDALVVCKQKGEH